MRAPIRLAVLLSGGGGTPPNLLRRITDGSLPAQVVAVVSSKPGVAGLDRAERAGIPAAVVQRSACASREEFSRLTFDACRQARAELVCLAGYLQLLAIPPDFALRV